jgi:hypothetical protein
VHEAWESGNKGSDSAAEEGGFVPDQALAFALLCRQRLNHHPRRLLLLCDSTLCGSLVAVRCCRRTPKLSIKCTLFYFILFYLLKRFNK